MVAFHISAKAQICDLMETRWELICAGNYYVNKINKTDLNISLFIPSLILFHCIILHNGICNSN
jgi:hypothetical protein